MLTLAREEYFEGRELIEAVPERLRFALRTIPAERILEIRLRTGGGLAVADADGVMYVTHRGSLTKNFHEAIPVTAKDIRRGMELITRSSVYAFENEIKNGFVTLSGGHRIGICGEAVTENGRIARIKTVQSLNYRFAREIIGAADCVMDRIYDGRDIKNTLIVSPPMCGKTTMLRDIARQLSEAGRKVSIVDERGEIAACFCGTSPFGVGYTCDVLSGVNKAEGMLMMLRSMSPEVIVTDEIGGEEDFAAVREIKKRGVKIITSLHGSKYTSDGFETVIRLGGIGKCLNLQERC